MLRIISISAVILGFTLGCTTTQQRPEAHATAAAQCLETGSRIQAAGHCGVSPGRTYSADDVRNTGKVDVGDALQMLDPSITVHH